MAAHTTAMQTLKIVFFDKSPEFIDAIKRELASRAASDSLSPWSFAYVVSQEPLADTVSQHRVQAIVAPGNSFGHLGGGFDLAIAQYYFPEATAASAAASATKALQTQLQKVGGYNPPGSALLVTLQPGAPRLIHCATMVTPGAIESPHPFIFNCMWNILTQVREGGMSCVLMSGLGTGYGGVSAQASAASIGSALQLYKRALANGSVDAAELCRRVGVAPYDWSS